MNETTTQQTYHIGDRVEVSTVHYAGPATVTSLAYSEGHILHTVHVRTDTPFKTWAGRTIERLYFQTDIAVHVRPLRPSTEEPS